MTSSPICAAHALRSVRAAVSWAPRRTALDLIGPRDLQPGSLDDLVAGIQASAELIARRTGASERVAQSAAADAALMTSMTQVTAAEREALFSAIRHKIPLDVPWRGEALNLIASVHQYRADLMRGADYAAAMARAAAADIEPEADRRTELRGELERLTAQRKAWEETAQACVCPAGGCSRAEFRDHQGDSPGCMVCADLDPDQPCYAAVLRGLRDRDGQ